MKNTITSMKYALEGVTGRIDDTEEWVRDVEDRVVVITQTKQKKR